MPNYDYRVKSADRRTLAPGILVSPKLGIGDIVIQLWRAKWLMCAVFLPIMALGVVGAIFAPEKFVAHSSLHVALGDEYVYRSSVGAMGDGRAAVAPEIGSMTQSELELIGSAEVAERALETFKVDVLYPKIAKACETKRAKLKGDAAKLEQLAYDCHQTAVDALRSSFEAGAAPKTQVIGTAFEHKDAKLSAEVLNAIVANYLTYRAEVFGTGNSSGFAAQRQQFEAQLLDTENELRAFLTENNIGDFVAERQTATALYQSASSELLITESKLRQVEGQLHAFRKQIESIEPQQDLYVEDSTQQAMLTLQLEREEKLTRFREGSRTIQELDKRIAQTEAYIKSQDGPIGTVRRGPNPLYQQVNSSLNNLSAESAALRGQRQELKKQIRDFEERQRRLINLEPQHQNLLRQRELLDRNVRSFAEREVESRAHTELVQQNVDNIRVIERAIAPVEGESLKLPIFALSFLLAAFTALIAGLIRTFTRNGFSTAHSVERTLGLPVLASVGKAK